MLASELRTCDDQWQRELSVPSDETFVALVLSQSRTNTACMMTPLRRDGNLEQELRDVTEKYKPGNSTRSDCKTNICLFSLRGAQGLQSEMTETRSLVLASLNGAKDLQ